MTFTPDRNNDDGADNNLLSPKLGTGIAAISKVSVAKEIANNELAILDWKGENLSVDLYMLWSKKRELAQHVRKFIQMIRQA